MQFMFSMKNLIKCSSAVLDNVSAVLYKGSDRCAHGLFHSRNRSAARGVYREICNYVVIIIFPSCTYSM